MNDTTVVSLSRIILTALWATVFILVAASWVMMLTGHSGVTHALGYTACTLSAVAAVAHIRCYAVRGLGVIRAIEDARRREAGSIHPVR